MPSAKASRNRAAYWLLAGALALTVLPTTAADRSHLPEGNVQTTVASSPQRIVSLSLCADDLLLDLVPDARIAAVSYLAADARYSRHAQRASTLRLHHGFAEQIVALQPDLVLAAEYEQGRVTTLLQQLGYPVHVLATPTQLADVAGAVRALAVRLGVEREAEVKLQHWQQSLQRYNPSETKQTEDAASTPLAISLAPNAYTPGQQSIKNELLRWTGYRTASDVLGLPFDQALSLEQIVLLAPARIFLEEQQGNRAALAYQLLEHPALRESAGAEQAPVAINSANWLCPGFGLADAAAQLAAARP